MISGVIGTTVVNMYGEKNYVCETIGKRKIIPMRPTSESESE